jgi:hypothetical protein
VPLLIRRLASGPAVAGACRSDSPRLQEPCEAMLEALGAIGEAQADAVVLTDEFARAITFARTLTDAVVVTDLIIITYQARCKRCFLLPLKVINNQGP